jgi:hypothetical protein
MTILIVRFQIGKEMIVKDEGKVISCSGIRMSWRGYYGLSRVVGRGRRAVWWFTIFGTCAFHAIVRCNAVSIRLTQIISLFITRCPFIVVLNTSLVFISSFIFMVKPFPYETVFIIVAF